MGLLEGELAEALHELERRSLRRALRVVESAQDTTVVVEGRRLLMLSSNNYLGLATHPAVKEAARRALAEYGSGTGASRLVAGNLMPLTRLEQHLAAFKGVEAALVFGSGYLANIGVLGALAGPGDAVLSDELNHASLIDGCRLSRARVAVYRHRDMAHLRELLKDAGAARRRFIVTDAVFSMDGDAAPLAEIVELARAYRAAIILDEAHGVGVLGPGGRGLAAACGLAQEVDVHIGTLSKALGAYGAYVAGSSILRDYLVNRARSFIYSTGLPPAVAAAAEAALAVLEAEPALVERLHDNARYLRAGLEGLGFRIGPTESPILPVIVGEAEAALRLSRALLARGVYVTAIRPPTVPAGTARLRVTPIATHTRDQLDVAIAAFAEAAREVALI
ncbi:MAG TPA: 8-amino-7-oxononanoate synthase [Candidatus Binataceae bacterium]|jgi:8-amino-7-oxononanoate synthase|nr:8-amino-7-oxononanoate synthase [Candidatus Binataceae bacterium]